MFYIWQLLDCLCTQSTDKPSLFVFCIYMDNDIKSYKNTLGDAEALLTVYSQIGHVILAGDFNGKIIEKQLKSLHTVTTKSQLLSNFVQIHELVSLQKRFR